MEVTLTYNGTTIILPPDLAWTDEHSWAPVEQRVATSLTGAALIDVAAYVGQRPITLTGDESHAWMPFALVQTLKTWAAIPGCQMLLNIRGVSYAVVFRHHEKPAVDLVAVVDYSTPATDDWFYGALKFMEI